jgi:hypothetical protein
VLVLGNLSFPLAVKLGFVQERPQAAWLGGR